MAEMNLRKKNVDETSRDHKQITYNDEPSIKRIEKDSVLFKNNEE